MICFKPRTILLLLAALAAFLCLAIPDPVSRVAAELMCVLIIITCLAVPRR
jgi:hypothetical protein